MKEIEIKDAKGFYKGTLIYGHIGKQDKADRSAPAHFAPGRFPEYTVIRTQQVKEGPHEWRVIAGKSGSEPSPGFLGLDVVWLYESSAVDLDLYAAIDFARELAAKWGL